MSSSTHTTELDEARATYFSLGGIESDIGPRDDPNWYWRRAAKMAHAELQQLKASGKSALPDDVEAFVKEVETRGPLATVESGHGSKHVVLLNLGSPLDSRFLHYFDAKTWADEAAARINSKFDFHRLCAIVREQRAAAGAKETECREIYAELVATRKKHEEAYLGWSLCMKERDDLDRKLGIRAEQYEGIGNAYNELAAERDALRERLAKLEAAFVETVEVLSLAGGIVEDEGMTDVVDASVHAAKLRQLLSDSAKGQAAKTVVVDTEDVGSCAWWQRNYSHKVNDLPKCCVHAGETSRRCPVNCSCHS